MRDVTENGLSLDDVSSKYGIQLVRVRALLKLDRVRKGWKCDVSMRTRAKVVQSRDQRSCDCVM